MRSFLSPPKTVTTIASSEIFYPDECPAELLNVQPDDVPPDSLETIHAERIMLVSEYTEHASYLNCKRKISDDSVTDSADLKCPVCRTSKLLTDCQRKVNVKVKLQLDSPWLTLFQHVWEPHFPLLHGLDDVTHALLNDLRNVTFTVDTRTRIIKEITVNSDTNLMPAAQQDVNNVATVDKQEESVSHFFQEIDDDLQHCGADERVESGGKGEKNTPVSKETKRRKLKT